MANRNMFSKLDNVRNEVDGVFRNAGYIRPFGADFLVPLTTRHFQHTTFSGDERKIYASWA